MANAEILEIELKGRYLGDVYVVSGKAPYFAPAPDEDYTLSAEELRVILKAIEKPQEYLDGLAENAASREYLGDGIFAENH